MRFRLILFFFLSPIIVLAQGGTITGKVARLDTKTVLAKATVFLSNSSYGTSANDDGTFSLTGIKPGQYQLVVTMVGFEDFNQTVMVGKDPIKINAELMPRVTQLHEVVISTPENWKRNYAMFMKEFIGTSENAKKCKVLNPHAVSLIYRKSKETLEAWSDDFIEIENKALGYKLKVQLKDFKCNNLNEVITWEAKLVFEELPGKAAQKKAWEAKRNDIYYGSSQHFFRSIQNTKLNEDGFVVMILQRQPNPNRPPQDLIMRKITQFDRAGMTDSANRWKRLYNLKRYDENLIRHPLKETDFATTTNQPGVFAIQFPRYLYVVYKNKLETLDFKDIYRPLDMANYETSIINLYKPYALFDANGTILSSGATMIEGTWSKNKMAELLPLDYAPGDMVLTEK